MKIIIKKYQELSTDELYALLRLRSEVFVVEQDCVYQDIDNKDQNALHIMGWQGDELAAYTRCFGPGFYFDQPAIGRVVVQEDYRGQGLANAIMRVSINALQTSYGLTDIKLSAQTYLLQFYRDLGFETVGEEYLEDGIPHMAMIRPADVAG
ncbi:GNAT family N-acetyltransferase [Aureitalea marina]|uniref:GNAT family N-acetyltransferase n=1 Tax=Aureitalea marina TaxID=930804 RepID=A0A2S7KS44_9FLAO|nr:GNAT family N-acetyltransferase [Aureitalea marina]PQB05452.1 GNAT family N-acetyltransferase [Aureitalea marina]